MKKQKSERTKEYIIDAYLDLIKTSHWEKITVKEIYHAANITRSTFYQYFNSIYDLMEQIEESLLAELKQSYLNCNYYNNLVITPSTFEEKFDLSPPPPLYNWFNFCMKYKNQMSILLSDNSDPYFIIKLKVILNEEISRMMDSDGMPSDRLRAPFVKAFIELHLISVKTWLSADKVEFLSINEIINLLNTMRIGGNYLSHHNSD